MEQAQKPTYAIVHPSDEAEVRRLLSEHVANKAQQQLIVGPPSKTEVNEGPLMKAYRESKEAEAALRSLGQNTVQGMKVTGVWWDEQHKMDKTQLEIDLENSLWARAREMVAGTPENVALHSPHMAGSDNRVRRVGSDHVHVLCNCGTAMRFNRCVHNKDDFNAERCTEEVPVIEAGWANCVLHRDNPSGAAWKPGSRFYRCDFIYDLGVQCERVATMESADGRHWCGQGGHTR
jgi:hypothetical protein